MDLPLMFTPSMPVLELVIRGSFTFLMLFILIRVVGRRESASVSMTDVLVVVLVADAASTGMNGGSETLGDGFVLVLVILFWSVTLDALSYRFAWFRKLVKSGPRPLIEDGKMIRKSLRREFLTEGEVMTQLRVHGIEDPRQVHRAYLEANGNISILSYHDDDDARQTISDVDRNGNGKNTD